MSAIEHLNKAAAVVQLLREATTHYRKHSLVSLAGFPAIGVHRNADQTVFVVSRSEQARIVTENKFSELRSAISLQLGFPATTQFQQLVGDSTLFPTHSVKEAIDYFTHWYVPGNILLFGGSGKQTINSDGVTTHADANGILQYLLNTITPADYVIANTVEQTYKALTDWKCLFSPRVRTYIHLVADTSDDAPTTFGDDIDTSDNLTNHSICVFDGGPQSMVQCANCIIGGVPVYGLAGLRDAATGTTCVDGKHIVNWSAAFAYKQYAEVGYAAFVKYMVEHYTFRPKEDATTKPRMLAALDARLVALCALREQLTPSVYIVRSEATEVE